MGGEKKINGDANQVDNERNRRPSIFLPINPLKIAKINTSGFNVSKRLGDRINLKYTRSGKSILSHLVYAGVKAWHTNLNIKN